MSLRTDRVSGILTAVLGLFITASTVASLALIGFQNLLLTRIREMPPTEAGLEFAETIGVFQDIWRVFMPPLLVGGVVYALSGYLLLRGSQRARRVAQFNTVCGLVWAAAYTVSSYRLMDTVMPPLEELPEPARMGMIAIGLLMGAGFNFGILAGLLFALSRPRK